MENIELSVIDRQHLFNYYTLMEMVSGGKLDLAQEKAIVEKGIEVDYLQLFTVEKDALTPEVTKTVTDIFTMFQRIHESIERLDSDQRNKVEKNERLRFQGFDERDEHQYITAGKYYLNTRKDSPTWTKLFAGAIERCEVLSLTKYNKMLNFSKAREGRQYELYTVDELIELANL